jgi:hypothetical protein
LPHHGVTTTTPPARDSFDLSAHHRKRTRQAEARADMYEQQNAQLIRLLIITLERQFRDTHVDPIQYLHHLVETDLLCRDLGLDTIALHRLAA